MADATTPMADAITPMADDHLDAIDDHPKFSIFKVYHLNSLRGSDNFRVRRPTKYECRDSSKP